MKHTYNSKIFSYEHYKSGPTQPVFFTRILSILGIAFSFVAFLLLLFLLLSPDSNNSIFRKGNDAPYSHLK